MDRCQQRPAGYRKTQGSSCFLQGLGFNRVEFVVNGSSMSLLTRLTRFLLTDECKCGNLLKQHLADFWNNESYVKMRRTLNRRSAEDFVPQCRNCHNMCCFEGPNHERAHILQLNGSTEHHGLPVLAC